MVKSRLSGESITASGSTPARWVIRVWGWWKPPASRKRKPRPSAKASAVRPGCGRIPSREVRNEGYTAFEGCASKQSSPIPLPLHRAMRCSAQTILNLLTHRSKRLNRQCFQGLRACCPFSTGGAIRPHFGPLMSASVGNTFGPFSLRAVALAGSAARCDWTSADAEEQRITPGASTASRSAL